MDCLIISEEDVKRNQLEMCAALLEKNKPSDCSLSAEKEEAEKGILEGGSVK
jgi:hypothetical protein